MFSKLFHACGFKFTFCIICASCLFSGASLKAEDITGNVTGSRSLAAGDTLNIKNGGTLTRSDGSVVLGSGDANANNTINVESGGTIANGGNGYAVSLNNHSTLNVTGTVTSSGYQTVFMNGGDANTVHVLNGGVVQNTVTGASYEAISVGSSGTGNTITIDDGGTVQSTGQHGIELSGGTTAITVGGVLRSTSATTSNNGVWSDANATANITVQSTGVVSATGGNAITLAGGSITNSGTISGNIVSNGDVARTIKNYKTITGNITTGGGDDQLSLYSNSTISGTIDLGAGTDKLYLGGHTTEDSNINNVETLEVHTDGTGASLTGTASFNTVNVVDGNATLGSNVSITAGVTFNSGAASTTYMSVKTAGSVAGDIQLASFTNTFEFANDVDRTYTGVISGNGGKLRKSGSGVLTLTGNNTYTGSTTVTAGTLKGSTTSLKGNISNNATVTFDQAGAGTYTGAVSGSGALTKTGAGVLTLTGNNSYSGDTTISAGSIKLGASNRLANSTDVIVAVGATFDVNDQTETVGSISGAGNITLGSGALTAGNSSDQAYSGVMSGTGSFTKVGTGKLTLTGNNTYSGGTTVSAGTLEGNTASLKGNITNNGTVTFNQTSADTYTGVISGSGAFTKTGAQVLTISGTQTYTGNTTISAGTLKLNSSQLLSNSTDVLIESGATLALNNTSTETVGSISGAGSINLGTGGILSVDNSSDKTFSGVISGGDSCAFSKSGTGKLTLSGNNTYTGGTKVGAGTIAIGADNRISDSSALRVDSGATFMLNDHSEQVKSITGAGSINLGSGTLSTGGGTTFSGVISGTGSLVKVTADILTLSGTNTYTGDTTVNSGTLTLGASNVLHDSTDVVVSGGTTFNVAGYTEAVATISGAGNITLGSGALTAGDASDKTYSGVMSGTGSFTKTGTGKLTLSGNNTYSGGTTVSAGTLEGTTASLKGNITNNGSVVFNQGVAGTYTGVISGTGGLTKSGAGVLTLSGTNSYSGATTVSAGTLKLGASNVLGDSTAVSLAAGTTFDFDGNSDKVASISGSGSVALGAGTMTLESGDDQTFAGVISGSGNVAKSGAGVLTITGNNTYSGTTTVSEGGLVIGTAAGGSVDSAVTVSGGWLGGGGEIAGNLSMDGGSLKPGNSIGTLTVTGNYTQAAGTTYEVEIAADETSDKIAVTGTATINGGSVKVLRIDSDDRYKGGTDYTILTAAGGVSGKYTDIVEDSARMNFELKYESNKVLLSILSMEKYEKLAKGTNQKTLGIILDSISQTATGDMSKVMNDLDTLSEGALDSAMSQITPTVSTVLPTVSHTAMRQFNGSLQQRMTTVRLGSFYAANTDAEGLLLASGASEDEEQQVLALAMAAAQEPKKWNVFIKTFGTWAEQDTVDGNAGYDVSIGGLTGGFDRRLGDNFLVGFACGGSWAGIKHKDVMGSDSDVSSLYTSVYGSWFTDKMHVDLTMGYAHNWYDADRRITFGGVNRVATSDHNGNEWSTSLGGGYRFDCNGFVIEPTLSLEYVTLCEDGYSESGAGALNVSVNESNSYSLQSVLGLRLARSYKMASGITFVLEVRGQWRHEFREERAEGSARLAGGGGSFTVSGHEVDRNRACLGTGLTGVISDTTSCFVHYDAEFGNDFASHTAQLGLRLNF